jgi:CO/xanthine dehydrogenase FAD-binding subunit
MLPEFLSKSAKTKEEVLSYISDLEDVKVLAGGTDLIVRMRKGEVCKHVVDIMDVPEIKGVARDEEGFRIGATTTHYRISSSQFIKMNARSLFLACGLIGSPQIRNMGTIGGNLINASPAADTIPPLLVHDAVLGLESKGGERKEKIEDFIIAPYKTSMKSDELLTFVHIKRKRFKDYREGYRRVTKRATLAIARLSVAWAIHEYDGLFHDVRLAIGSCTPMPFRPRSVEKFLKGNKKEEHVIIESVKMILEEIRRITGGRPSFIYKIPVLKDLLESILRG